MEKQGKSASKRIALFIFVGAGIVFTLVAMSILNSGDGVKSGNAPVNLFEASRGAESITLPKPKPPEIPEPEPEPEPAPPPKRIILSNCNIGATGTSSEISAPENPLNFAKHALASTC